MKSLFSSDNEAAQFWGEQNRPLSEVKERMAFIYAVPGEGARTYYLGRTYTGMGKCGPFRPNVVIPFMYLYMTETLQEWLRLRSRPVALVHTHPRPSPGMTCRHHSREDRMLLKLPGIHAVYVVPYENDEVNRFP